MNEFDHSTLKDTYQKLYSYYESLIQEMRLYWEKNYGVLNYHDNFFNEFGDKRSHINSLITKNLSNLSKELSSTTPEINKFAEAIQKLNKNLNFHYYHYHVSKIPV